MRCLLLVPFLSLWALGVVSCSSGEAGMTFAGLDDQAVPDNSQDPPSGSQPVPNDSQDPASDDQGAGGEGDLCSDACRVMVATNCDIDLDAEECPAACRYMLDYTGPCAQQIHDMMRCIAGAPQLVCDEEGEFSASTACAQLLLAAGLCLEQEDMDLDDLGDSSSDEGSSGGEDSSSGPTPAAPADPPSVAAPGSEYDAGS